MSAERGPTGGLGTGGRSDDTPPPGAGLPPRPGPTPSGPVRKAFGVVLFIAWGIMALLWVWTNIHLIANGDINSLVSAIFALGLLVLLGSMEGLEVSVIDRSDELWPGKPTSYLAGWLAARQLFVALIVTTATLLANRSVIFIPIAGVEFTGAILTGAFDTVFTGLTVLWFAQILPKHLGAINPDRYLRGLRGLFPVVHAVHRMGISQPGEWAADVLESRLGWTASSDEAARHVQGTLTHPAIWRQLIGPRGPGRSLFRRLFKRNP